MYLSVSDVTVVSVWFVGEDLPEFEWGTLKREWLALHSFGENCRGKTSGMIMEEEPVGTEKNHE
jgi:hypothetical protein